MQTDVTKKSVKNENSVVIHIKKINQKASGKEYQKPKGQIENRIKW